MLLVLNLLTDLIDGISVCILVLIFGGFTAFCKFIIASSTPPYTANLVEVGTFDTSAFITTYFPIPFFLVLLFGYKFLKKSKFHDFRDLDFKTGSSARLAIDPPKKGFLARIADEI
jgi:yeast amino acid transporter